MKRISCIFGIAAAFGIAWLLSINPAKEYGWFMGLVHGSFFVPNYIISLFNDGWLFKAPIHTSMYNIDWWIFTVLCCFSWLGNLKVIIYGK